MRSIFILLLLFQVLGFKAQTLPEELESFYWDLAEHPYEVKFKMLEEAINYYPNEPWFLWMRAGIYEMKGDEEKALENYEMSLKLDSNFVGGHASLARFIRYSGKTDKENLNKALRHINRAIELDPSDNYFKIDRAYIYIGLKEFELAEKDADFSLTAEDVDEMASAQLKIELLFETGKRNELELFVKEHDLSDSGEFLGTDFCYLLASVYTDMGQKDKACKLYRGAAENFLMMDEPLPNVLKEKLKNCK